MMKGLQMFSVLTTVLFTFVLGSPVKLIIDTDIGGGGCNDVDDVVAVCIANALVDNGDAELIAIVQNTAPLECAGAISVLDHFYGRDDIPIGAYNINTPYATLQQQQPLPYVTDIVGTFDSPVKHSTQVDDAVVVYRRALAAQPDRSVAISSIGIHTNLAGTQCAFKHSIICS
jgi:inosine-uridine nucleoside N-ribohydrolase